MSSCCCSMGAIAPPQVQSQGTSVLGGGASATPALPAEVTTSVANAGAQLIAPTTPLPVTNVPATSQIIREGNNSLAWAGAPNSITDTSKSQGVYDRLADLIRRYPTEDALKAAGWQPTEPNGSHYTPPKEVMDQVLNDGETHMQHLVVDKGVVIGAQFNSDRYDVPPTWGGLWHRHEDKANPRDKLWMAHIYVNKAFGPDAFAK